MEKSVPTVNEALEILRNSLERCGLEKVNISVSSHGLTSTESGALVKDLLANGFGETVTEAGQVYDYLHQPGRYSWVTVAQGNDLVNLFYNLEVTN